MVVWVFTIAWGPNGKNRKMKWKLVLYRGRIEIQGTSLNMEFVGTFGSKRKSSTQLRLRV